MLKKLKIQKDLPLEVGKSYATKIHNAGLFTVQRIALNKKGEQMTAWGVYEDSKHLGMCPIGADRLIHEKETDTFSEVEVCEHCGL